MNTDLSKARWFKSTRSGAAGHCVMTAMVKGGVAVRDSKDPSGPVLRFSGSTWTGFVADIKDGKFGLDA